MEHALFDCRQDYERALKGLAHDPDNIEYKHQAVLALARSGSLAFAESEFQRYGLDQITSDEDVLGLKARLLKDAFIQNDAPDRSHIARQSADVYAQAFHQTGGYYSGINAATMTFLADGPAETIREMAQIVLDRLPEAGTVSKTDLYFIEATRAEAFLLLSDTHSAENAIRSAWQHDPVNYIAQASTLKQLKMICSKRAESQDWLNAFAPPSCMHFAGHTYAMSTGSAEPHSMTGDYEAKLKAEISNTLQKHDIAFGYGALSAGSDILIAECLLEEGGELNVVLPVDVDRFKASSVTAFGGDWNARFEDCLCEARSVKVVEPHSDWPSRSLNQYAAKIAMGHAIMQADLLSSEKTQMLILSGERGESYTDDHFTDWKRAGFETHVLDLPIERPSENTKPSEIAQSELKIALQTNDGSQTDFLDAMSISDAASTALDVRKSSPRSRAIGLHSGTDDGGYAIQDIARTLAEAAVPGSLIVSEDFAALLAVEAGPAFSLHFAGRVDAGPDGERAVYSLGRTGDSFTSL
ncbi:MAG: TRAFs-binding domain-containing protein [Pseudomonadota bacterium]